jgi:hypothetical protein
MRLRSAYSSSGWKTGDPSCPTSVRVPCSSHQPAGVAQRTLAAERRSSLDRPGPARRSSVERRAAPRPA